MQLKLVRQNFRYEPVEPPTLKELLEHPLVIEQPIARNRRNYLVWAEWKPAHEWLLGGILVIDHENQVEYFTKQGEYTFEKHEGTDEPWHSDKFWVYGNYYETQADFAELKAEFEKLGFVFP